MNEYSFLSDSCYTQFSLPIFSGDLKPVENIGELTLLVNGINNILTTYGIILTFLGVVVAIISIIGYRYLLEKINLKEKELKDLKDELTNIKNQYKKEIDDFSDTKKRLNIESVHLQKSNDFVFHTLREIADRTGQKQLLNKITLDKYKVDLFSVEESDRFASIMFLQENGQEDVIELLEYVSEHDAKIEYRKLANIAIGVVRSRINPESSTGTIVFTRSCIRKVLDKIVNIR